MAKRLLGIASTGLLYGLLVGCSSSGSSSFVGTLSSPIDPSTGKTSASDPVAAPSWLAYSRQSIVVNQGVAIALNAPSNAGGKATEYTVHPTLPAGITLNATTGVLSGLPTVPQAPVYYRVVARNAAGSTATTVAIQVVPKDGYTAQNLQALTGPVQYHTDFNTMPFGGDVFAIGVFGASAGLAPLNFFWQEGNHYNNPDTLKIIKEGVASAEAKGLIPYTGMQRWQDTWVESLPPSAFKSTAFADASACPMESNYEKEHYAPPNTPLDPAMKAWSDFIGNHGDLTSRYYTGDLEPSGYLCFGGSWGYISHLTPLDPQDCPEGLTSCTYGDLEASQWAGAAALTGISGVGMADFYDSSPDDNLDFNPRIVDAFASWLGRPIPGATVAEQAAYIFQNQFNAWTDFNNQGWARYLAAFAYEVQEATGKQPTISVQCGATPSASRMVAADHRIWANYLNPGTVALICDQTTLWSDRPGVPSIVDIGQSALLAANEPEYRFGANMVASAPVFWSDVREAIVTAKMPVSNSGTGSCWSGGGGQKALSPDECEWGLKEIKHGVLELSWTHIADQAGAVRRALAWITRYDSDTGTWNPEIDRLAQGLRPTQPFGYAYYYSRNIEKSVENTLGQKSHGDKTNSYIPDRDFWALKYADQAAVNFLVSDLAFPAIANNPKAKPGAWIVRDVALLDDAEKKQLTDITPTVLSTDADIIAYNASGKAPLSFSSNVSGMGFYDQNDRLIVTATNLKWETNAEAAFTLVGLAGGSYRVTELATEPGATGLLDEPIEIVAGKPFTLKVALERYDTRVFALTLQ